MGAAPVERRLVALSEQGRASTALTQISRLSHLLASAQMMLPESA